MVDFYQTIETFVGLYETVDSCYKQTYWPFSLNLVCSVDYATGLNYKLTKTHLNDLDWISTCLSLALFTVL